MGRVRDWLKVLLIVLDDVLALALVLLLFWFLGIKIPLAIMIFLALLLGTFIFFVHRAVLPTLYKKLVTGPEGMLGLECQVVEPLTPKGVVRVKGEYWKATSVDGDVADGERVEILKVDGLTLKVRCKVKK